MVEMHGWITIKETFLANDDDNNTAIISDINNELMKFRYHNSIVKWMNGEGYLQYSLYTNYWSDDCQELIDIYNYISRKAIGSYGLLYVMNDEAKIENNSFVFYKLARGRIERVVDNLLSPFIPTVEDSN